MALGAGDGGEASGGSSGGGGDGVIPAWSEQTVLGGGGGGGGALKGIFAMGFDVFAGESFVDGRAWQMLLATSLS
jgi:hypothetical protein